ncbi:MAG: AAA domain-containing protein [Thermoleophilia bacterium]
MNREPSPLLSQSGHTPGLPTIGDPAAEADRRAKAAYLERLRELIIDERETSKRTIHRIWSTPIPARVGKGYAIEGIEIGEIGLDGTVRLQCSRNQSRFREGDDLCLNRGDPFSPPSIMVKLEEDNGTDLVVSPDDMGIPWGQLMGDRTGWILDQGLVDLSAFYLEAIQTVGETAIGRERILPLLMGEVHPAIDTSRMERGLAQGEEEGLNWTQAEALALAYASDSVYLIQGPPGTGKTRVLAHLAAMLADEGERVFVTSFTHRAINNALNTLANVAPLTPTAKIGHPSRADDLDVDCYGGFSASPMASMKGGYVIGATPFAARTSRLSGVEFDTVIFDEASQITVPLALMAMLSGKKYVFVGDHRQLPPVLTSLPASEAVQHSVFGRLTERGFDTMLRETYRLNEALIEWPNRQFYAGQLVCSEEAAGWQMDYASPPAKFAEILRADRPKVFVDLGHKNTTTRSTIEAGFIVDLILTLIESGVEPKDMGVVTPYRAQAREIRTLLRQATAGRTETADLVVDTVERMQGQERDLVILSLTTSNPAFALGLADFFYQPERLNVAVTRPRKKLIIVGSAHLFDIEPEEPEVQEAIALLEDLVKTCDSLVPEGQAG